MYNFTVWNLKQKVDIGSFIEPDIVTLKSRPVLKTADSTLYYYYDRAAIPKV